MSIKETNKLISLTNISKSLNTLCVTRQKTSHTKASVSHNIPSDSTYVTTTVSKSTVSYNNH